MGPDDYYYYEEARRRVREKKKFHKRLFSFIGLSIFFVILNLVTYSGHFWAVYPILGMGLGVWMKASKVYGPFGSQSSWEDREIQKEYRKLARKENEDLPPPPAIRKSPKFEEKLELKELKKEKLWDEKDLV